MLDNFISYQVKFRLLQEMQVSELASCLSTKNIETSLH
jgi:hypothetical protein